MCKMKVLITIRNPHDPARPTCLTCDNCGETLDDVVQAVYFWMEYCQVIEVSVEEKPCVTRIN